MAGSSCYNSKTEKKRWKERSYIVGLQELNSQSSLCKVIIEVECGFFFLLDICETKKKHSFGISCTLRKCFTLVELTVPGANMHSACSACKT